MISLNNNAGAGGLGTNAGAVLGTRSRLTNNEYNATADTDTTNENRRGAPPKPNTDDHFWQHATYLG